MKKGLGAVGIIIIIVVVVLVALVGWWQYRMYQQRKAIQEIEDQIMNGTFPGLNQ